MSEPKPNAIDAFLIRNTSATNSTEYDCPKVLCPNGLFDVYNAWIKHTFYRHPYADADKVHKELHAKMLAMYPDSYSTTHMQRIRRKPRVDYHTKMMGTWNRCQTLASETKDEPKIAFSEYKDFTYEVTGYAGVCLHDDTSFSTMVLKCIWPNYGQNWDDSPAKKNKGV